VVNIVLFGTKFFHEGGYNEEMYAYGCCLKGIVIAQNVGGKEPLDVGTIVDKDTVVKIKGETASIKDLKVGDMVTIRYIRSNDLYAKEIMKK
jgi:hypothetical protein